MAIDLSKRAEKVGIVLQKKGLTSIPPVRVGVAMDYSGSASGFYSSGQMQETLERLMGVALKFDDNGELDTWFFHDISVPGPTCSTANAENFIANAIRSTGVRFGGTAYAPVMRDMLNYYFPSAVATVTAAATGFFGKLFGSKTTTTVSSSIAALTKPLPAYGIFITDGETSDSQETMKVLRESSKQNMYWTLVGLGSPSQFSLLKSAANELDNVGFVNLNSLSLSDDDLYNQLITDEVVTWLKKQ